ncbi:hypothetical protein [Tamlana crocina]|uniref:Secretion system C-terminal sorting domain-containing protein n=1 Tax=Tamlana crocina TaxID=393006 RepID=A0ABX1DA19_9FLAO|nr:hypothetical protein [Tamlana crocina]NJX15227.1 hypothetical protein [Tamlana crocina]
MCTLVEQNNYARFEMVDSVADKNEEKIYMSIDHLEKGTYILHILLKNKVVKTITINKE